MKWLTAVVFLFSVVALQSSGLESDDALRQRFVGTWWGEEDVGLESYSYGEKTYRSDGTASGFIDDWSEGKRERTVFRSTWKIEDGHLISHVVFTNMPEFLPPKEDIVDKIVSIDHRKMVLIAEIDHHEYSRYRKSP